MRLRWRILLVTGPVLAFGLFMVVTHYRARAAAERFKAQLRAEGEKLSIEECIPAPLSGSAAPNGAQDFLNAYASLSRFDYKFQPAAMAMVQPGRARIAWMQRELPTRESSNVWPQLRAYAETNAAALGQLHEALRKPVLQFPINYHQGFSALLRHLAPLKGASSVLSSVALLEMHDRRTDQAFTNLQALVTLPGSFRSESFMISQLVRYAIVTIAANATGEALEYPQWSDEQLARLQSAWEAISLMPELESSLAMERACVLEEYAKCRETPSRLHDLAGSGSSGGALGDLADVGQQLVQDPAEGLEALVDRFPRRWSWKWWNSYDDEVWFLRAHHKQLGMGRRAAGGEPFALIRDEARANSKQTGKPPKQFLLACMLADEPYLMVVQKAMTAEAQRRIVIIAIALKRFERRNGKLPDALSDLMPELLKETPLDPMNARPLHYRSTGGKSFLLYSVGTDGKDDGGDPHPPSPSAQSPFWMTCVDWVWPQPASPEELREYHEKLGQKRSRGE